MEEMALRWIERVGFPILVSCMAVYGAYRLFLMREKERLELEKARAEAEQKTRDALMANTRAMDINTASNHLVSESVDELAKKQIDLCKGGDLQCEARVLAEAIRRGT